jgi:hypothetical protein
MRQGHPIGQEIPPSEPAPSHANRAASFTVRAACRHPDVLTGPSALHVLSRVLAKRSTPLGAGRLLRAVMLLHQLSDSFTPNVPSIIPGKIEYTE